MKWTDNALIQQLASEPQWTFSTVKQNDHASFKVPVHAGLYLKTGKPYYYTKKRPNGTVTLAQLMPTNPDNFAYRLHAKDNDVVCLDIEPCASRETLEILARLPLLYLERSQHGGFHALLKLDWNPTFVSFQDPEQKVGKPEWELLANDHFVTLTGNVLPIHRDPTIDYDMMASQFFGYIQLHQQQQQAYHPLDADKVSNQLTVNAKQLLAAVNFADIQRSDRNYKQKHFGNGKVDVSRLEFALSLMIEDTLIKTAAAKHLTVASADIINVTARLIYKLYPVRLSKPEKYRTRVKDMPWLVYTAWKAYYTHYDEK